MSLEDYIREHLAYDPETGVITWIKKASRKVVVGKEAGGYHHKGYRWVRVQQKIIMSHRIAWFLYYGEWPSAMIDHKNRIKDDNCIGNLRLANKKQNGANRGVALNGTSKYKGVSWHKAAGMWCAQIRIEDKPKHLGTYDDETDAAKAYNEAAILHHGEFAYLNEL